MVLIPASSLQLQLINRGPEGPSAGCWFSLPHLTSNWSDIQLIWTSTAQSGVLRAPSAGCWFSLPHLTSNWLTSCLHPGYIIVRRPPCGRHKSHSIQPVHGQGYILIFLDRMHLLFTQVHFLFWQLGLGHICRCADFTTGLNSHNYLLHTPENIFTKLNYEIYFTKIWYFFYKSK